MELDNSFSNDDRNRIQALKSQLKWKCTNLHQGKQFHLTVNPYNRIHTIHFPKDNNANPTIYNYLLELTRAFYAEKYGPTFGDSFFEPETNKQDIPLYSALISVSQHWFTSQFCITNFESVWIESLKVKYQAFIDNPSLATNSIESSLNAALICAQLAFIQKVATSTLIGGTLQDITNIFMATDPTKVDLGPLAILVNNLLELYKSGQTLQFNQQRQGGFWKAID